MNAQDSGPGAGENSEQTSGRPAPQDPPASSNTSGEAQPGPGGPAPGGAWTAGAAPSPTGGAWAQGGPQAGGPWDSGWQQAPPGPPPAPEPPSGSGSFFDSVRRSGWYRADSRLLGGVCSGVSQRTGLDLGLVRALTVILGIFFGPVWIAYGVAWALLPEQRDGRIHLEQLTLGHFDIAQLGALAMVVLGLGNPFQWAFGSSNSSGYWVFTVIVIGVIVAIAAWVSSRNPRKAPPPAPAPAPYAPRPEQTPQAAQAAPAPGPVPPSAAPSPAPSVPAPGFAGAPRSSTTAEYPPASPQQPVPGAQRPPSYGNTWSATQPMPAGPAPWSTAPPTLPRRVSARANLAVTGLVVLAMAATFYLMHFYRLTEDLVVRVGLAGAGLCLVIVGLALIIASVRDRGAAWLVALSIVGILIAVPASIGGAALLPRAVDVSATAESSVDTSVQPPSGLTTDWTATSITALDSTTLDLTSAPSGTDKDITVTGPFSDLTVAVRQGQSVQFQVDGSAQNVTPVYYEGADAAPGWIPWVPEVSQIVDSLGFRTPWWSADHSIRVTIVDGSGFLTIVEEAPNAEEEGSQSGEEQQSGAQSDEDAPQSDDESQNG